jgi:hypothetical protein
VRPPDETTLHETRRSDRTDAGNIALFPDPSRWSAHGGSAHGEFLRFAIPPQLDFFGRNLALAFAEATIRSSVVSYLL